mgnify:CR=1 FL=1
MARYFLNIGANWGDTANWSDTDGGAGGFSVPTNTDDVYFTALSGNCTINTSLRQARILDFTGYTNTITLDNPLRSNNDLTLSASMTFAGASYLQVYGVTPTITSNGKVVPILRVGAIGGGSFTITLADDWYVGELQVENGSITLNGNTIFISTDYTPVGGGSSTGTTNLEFTGTGNISTGAVIRNNVTINSGGTITLGSTLNYQTGTFTDLGLGTVVTTGNTLTTTVCTYDTPNIVWNNVTVTNTGAFDIELLDVFNISGTLTKADEFPTLFVGSTINLSGSLNLSNGLIYGPTTDVILNGTGTWSASGTGEIRNNLTINTAGTITLSGTLIYQTGTFTHVAGTVDTTGSAVCFLGCSIDAAGITFNGLFLGYSSSATVTLLDDMFCTNLTTGISATAPTINGFTVTVTGDYRKSTSNIVNGTTVVIMTGTGTINITSPSYLPVEINTAGTITLAANVFFSKFTHITGTVDTTTNNSHVRFTGPQSIGTVIITNGTVEWNTVTFLNTNNYVNQLADDMTVNGTLNFGTSNSNFYVVNANKIYVNGSLSVPIFLGGSGGTTEIVMSGTGTVTTSISGILRNSLTIDTTGTITFSSSVNYSLGTINYVTGTVVTTGSSLILTSGASLNTDGIIWNSITITLPVGTYTLLSDLYADSIFITGVTNNILNGFKAYCSNLNVGAVTGTCSTDFVLNGTGTFNASATLVANVEIDTVGTVTFAPSINMAGTKTLKWTQGTVITSGSTFTISSNASFTIDWPKTNVSLWNLATNSGSVITFLKDTLIEGSFLSTTSATGIINGSTVFINGSFISRIGTTIGTSHLVMQGTGSVMCQLNGALQNNITIDTQGAITFDGPLNYSTGTFAILNGRIYHTGVATLTITGNTARFIGFDKTSFISATITSGMNIVMDRFFGGNNVANPTAVSSTLTTSQFNLEITDPVSIVHGATVAGCNVVTRNLRLTHAFANKGRNTNVLFGFADNENGLTKNLRTIFLRPQYLTETINFMTASGIVDNATIYFPSTQYQVRGYRLWEIMDEHIRNLKGQGHLNQTYNLWDKMIAVYPFVGGSAAAHKFNLINPLDTDAAFRLDYVNSLTHSGAGVTGAASAYALTNIIPSAHLLQDDVHISNFLLNVGNEYYEMGVFNDAGHYLYKRTRVPINYPPGADNGVNTGTFITSLETTGKHVILSRLNNTTVYAYNDGVSSNVAAASVALGSTEFPLFCAYNGTIFTYSNFSLSTHIYDSIGYGLTDAEAAMFYTVVNDLQKKLKRQ